DVLEQVAKQKLEAPVTQDVAPTSGGDGQPATAASAVATPSGPIRSREDAFRHLEQVATYFRTHEPHTVISYTLEQVVRWGRMPLPELLVELIPDDTVRLGLFRQVGIKPPPTPES